MHDSKNIRATIDIDQRFGPGNVPNHNQAWLAAVLAGREGGLVTDLKNVNNQEV